MSKPKIAIVVQRYAIDLVGGAELFARQTAEEIVRRLDWDVDVYTSAAQSYETWANHYTASAETIHGVRVHRFPVLFRRYRNIFGPFNTLCLKALKRLRGRPFTPPIIWMMEWLWFVLQGPYCPRLVRELKRRSDEYQKIFFVTYLYYPSIWGTRALGAKAVLIPTAHDEPYFYYDRVQRMLRDVPRILSLTVAEMGLITRQIPNQTGKVERMGWGIEIEASGQMSEGLRRAIGTEPYVLYLGRISAGKNVDQLIRAFVAFRKARGSSAQLLLAGKVEGLEIPEAHGVWALGFISDADKAHLIKGAAVLANPSPYDSLSMIVIEAMMLGVPALVNAHNPVLKSFTEMATTVKGYADDTEFVEQLAKLLTLQAQPSATWTQELVTTRSWATQYFSWEYTLGVVKKTVLG